MAINPFPRITPLDIPTYLPSAARAPEGTFNNIASIGDAIGEYRTRNRLSEVAQGAIDPTDRRSSTSTSLPRVLRSPALIR